MLICVLVSNASRIFGIVVGPKKRTISTTKNDFIFKGLPRADARVSWYWFGLESLCQSGVYS